MCLCCWESRYNHRLFVSLLLWSKFRHQGLSPHFSQVVYVLPEAGISMFVDCYKPVWWERTLGTILIPISRAAIATEAWKPKLYDSNRVGNHYQPAIWPLFSWVGVLEGSLVLPIDFTNKERETKWGQPTGPQSYHWLLWELRDTIFLWYSALCSWYPISNLNDDYGLTRGHKYSRNEQIMPSGEQSEVVGVTWEVPCPDWAFRFTSDISLLLLL